MRLVKIFTAMLCLLGIASSGFAAQQDEDQARLIAEAKKAVVLITVPGHHGSGFFVREDGYILTAAHMVLPQTSQLQVCPFRIEDERYGNSETKDCKPATVVGFDEVRDLALLKVEGTGYPTLKLGDDPPAGHRVIALGHPMYNRWSATVGIVSKNPVFLEDDTYHLQTDAAAYFGSSGGPLINMKGEVVGIIDSMEQPTPSSAPIFTFAVPVGDVKVLLPRLMQGGEVDHGGLGIAFAFLGNTDTSAPNLRRHRVPEKVPGTIIHSIQWNSAADKAGLRAYDVILKINGQVSGNIVELTRLIAFEKPGATVELEVMREGETALIKVVLGHDPRFVPQPRPETKKGGARPPQEP